MSFERRRGLGGTRTPGALTEPAGWRPPRWVVPLFGLAALLLVPWVVLLVFALPSAHRAAHWDIAWAGFDVALALLLLAVAVAAWRRSDRKSTRLNSSHRTISYAVFCLKKKTHSDGGIALGHKSPQSGHTRSQRQLHAPQPCDAA